MARALLCRDLAVTSPTGEELGYPAYSCPFCHQRGTWYLLREGDAVVSWSCDTHLPLVLESLQRRVPGSTKVVVSKVVKPCPTEGCERTVDELGRTGKCCLTCGNTSFPNTHLSTCRLRHEPPYGATS